MRGWHGKKQVQPGGQKLFINCHHYKFQLKIHTNLKNDFHIPDNYLIIIRCCITNNPAYTRNGIRLLR